MSIEEKYPLLIGHSSQGNQELHSIQEVADFICSQGMKNDLLITQGDGSYFLNTFGIYIDRIADMEYREALLEVLIPMQMELDGTLAMDEESRPENERLEEVNQRLEPFELYPCDSGKYGLSLHFSFLQEPYENYGQAAFNRFAEENGEEAKNSFGLYTHGSGYEWEKVFQTAFQEDAGLREIEFESEAGGFYCYSSDITLLERMGLAFKAICEDQEQFQKAVNRALSDEQEELPEMQL